MPGALLNIFRIEILAADYYFTDLWLNPEESLSKTHYLHLGLLDGC